MTRESAGRDLRNLSRIDADFLRPGDEAKPTGHRPRGMSDAKRGRFERPKPRRISCHGYGNGVAIAEHLRQEIAATILEYHQRWARPRRRESLECGHADRRNAEGKRQAARGRHGEPDAGKVAGARADGESVGRIPTEAGAASISSNIGRRRSA